ncbi:hypothetical protein RJ641_002891, partial [Dillenia turbinata]
VSSDVKIDDHEDIRVVKGANRRLMQYLGGNSTLYDCGGLCKNRHASGLR